MASDGRSYTIELNGIKLTTSDGNTSLLDSLEAANIEMQYHCRQGFCGVCRTRLLEGEVHYLVDPLAYMHDGEVLTCCSAPRSNVKLESDNL
jgi:ferredoxin